MAAVTTPVPIPATVDELVALLGDLATATAEQLEEKRGRARRRPHNTTCGEHRHDDNYLSGFLLGLATALALATGEKSDDVYNRLSSGEPR